MNIRFPPPPPTKKIQLERKKEIKCGIIEISKVREFPSPVYPVSHRSYSLKKKQKTGKGGERKKKENVGNLRITSHNRNQTSGNVGKK